MRVKPSSAEGSSRSSGTFPKRILTLATIGSRGAELPGRLYIDIAPAVRLNLRGGERSSQHKGPGIGFVSEEQAELFDDLGMPSRFCCHPLLPQPPTIDAHATCFSRRVPDDCQIAPAWKIQCTGWKSRCLALKSTEPHRAPPVHGGAGIRISWRGFRRAGTLAARLKPFRPPRRSTRCLLNTVCLSGRPRCPPRRIRLPPAPL